jgi:D-serine deaminase-like pyridoxal phosphate-dependent protein
MPQLILSEKQVRANIDLFVQKARHHHLFFRPHFKTHQSLQVGEWFREAGVNAITVSSLKMARRFAAAGWNDITIAFPLNMSEVEGYAQLAGEVSLNVLFDQPAQVLAFREKLKYEAGFFIKIDVGYHRAGVLPQQTPIIDELLMAAGSGPLKFKGFLTHAGQTYRAASVEEIRSIHLKTAGILQHLRQQYHGRYPGIITSTGDTPSCSLADDFSGIDEIRPGNFVYYDLMQLQLGSCRFEQIAAAVVCSVVSVYPERSEVLIYGGAVHLSKEVLEVNGAGVYGLVVPFKDGEWSGPEGEDYLLRLSQEHGILNSRSAWAKALKPGDSVAVIPVHSCLAVDLSLSEHH